MTAALARVPILAPAIRPAYFAHIVLYTARYEELIAWYRLVLGMEATVHLPGICALTFDDEHHRMAIVNRPGLADRPADTAGVAHFAYSYRTLDDLVATWERLGLTGVMPYWEINHGPTTSLYYRDPDGNQVELQVANFSSPAALNEWMSGGHFNANPIGRDIRFAELARRFRAGTPAAELLRPFPDFAAAMP